MNTQITTTAKRMYLLITCLFLSFLLSQCFLTQDRTTVVYGTITDQNGEPVDSILVLIDGVKGFRYETLKEMYSGKNGTYELVLEVPRKYSSVDVIIPFGSYVNPKFQKYYKDKLAVKNDKPTNDCCIATIGDKTKYDFQLIPR
ncbi:hypothetical protein DYBT9623_00944 [Dyadobacter sp. CECT 9623]|uniref:Carboxypeptidase regulatory-like domain-containing protein n=1 Tax=Dyadobacter linearis TaxID=2823330 RepID=A0ABM8ULL9_9BACT|nr:hypothetical protein [Dyadobacter sp. CECT 9623]CAG5068215.1 hypothetical protein DYBT9623_00944 [Dyadobacter sp. CECT 9623]